MKKFISIVIAILLFYILGYLADYIFPWFPNDGKLLTIINLLLPVVFVVGIPIYAGIFIYRKIPSKS